MPSWPPNDLFHFRWEELRPGPALDAFKRFFDKSTDDTERVRLARKILALDAPLAHCILFDVFQRMCMDSRWGSSNPLEELLGVLRVRALAVLRRPDGAQGRKHAAAAQVISSAAKPKDIPLLLSLLDRPAHTEMPLWIYWALSLAVVDLETADMPLIEAMERRLVPGRAACFDRIEASRLLDAHRVPAAEEALLRALPRLAPDEAIPIATALLTHDPVRHLAMARRIRDALPEGYPSEDAIKDGMGYPYHVFLESIESAEEGGAEEMAARARLAAIRGKLVAEPRPAIAPLLDGLRREDHEALTPVLCRLLTTSNDAAAGEVLRALGHRPAATRTLFHALDPWLAHADLGLRELAMRAALASRSDQARARLMSRLRRACTTDAADACTILRALAAESLLYREDAAPALASPFSDVRAAAESLLEAMDQSDAPKSDPPI